MQSLAIRICRLSHKQSSIFTCRDWFPLGILAFLNLAALIDTEDYKIGNNATFHIHTLFWLYQRRVLSS